MTRTAATLMISRPASAQLAPDHDEQAAVGAASERVFDIDWCKAGAAAVQGAVRGVAAGAGARR